jgi:5-methylcytosine-specific restriction endonuclease McrA
MSVCTEPGCPNLQPCPIHRDLRRSPSSRRTSTRQWAKTRAKIFQTYGHDCWLQLPGCTGLATQGDHVIPVSRGGTDDLTNLRPACAPCNNRKGNRA